MDCKSLSPRRQDAEFTKNGKSELGGFEIPTRRVGCTVAVIQFSLLTFLLVFLASWRLGENILFLAAWRLGEKLITQRQAKARCHD